MSDERLLWKWFQRARQRESECHALCRVLAGFAYSGKTNPKDRGHYFGCHWSVTGHCAPHCQAARAVRSAL